MWKKSRTVLRLCFYNCSPRRRDGSSSRYSHDRGKQMIETLGVLFRTLLTNLVNQRVIDVSSGDDNRVVFLFENGDTLAIDRFSYEPAKQEDADKLKAIIADQVGEQESALESLIEG